MRNEDSSRLEPKVVETDKVLNGLVRSMPCEIMYSLQPEYLSRYACLTLSLSACLQIEGLAPYTMPISGIEDVLPKIMEQDAGCGYCYAWHAETSETSGTRPELNSSPAPAFSEAAGVVSTARIERPSSI